MESVTAEFFYRKPLKDGEAKPAFGLSEPAVSYTHLTLPTTIEV